VNAAYLDTSGLLPLLDRDDSDHEAVVAALRRLIQTRTPLLTTSYALVEAGALVRSRLGVAAFRRLGETIDRAAEILWVDEELHRAAWSKAAASRRGPSLVDWVGLLSMERLGIRTALAIDRHFRQRGFETLPRARRGA
jgi:predicted nucleic acid-binding protein